jgi:hypothetical protein
MKRGKHRCKKCVFMVGTKVKSGKKKMEEYICKVYKMPLGFDPYPKNHENVFNVFSFSGEVNSNLLLENMIQIAE